jgi:SNF2 family DNA or RNA helicase
MIDEAGLPVTSIAEQTLGLPSPLREYQWNGVRFLTERDSALLADEMGLGKTVQVAVALSILFRASAISRALIVVPAALRLNWERELNRWAPELTVRRLQGDSSDRIACYRLPIQVLIGSYEQVRADAQVLCGEFQFDVVVLDEAQRIKNINARTALACRTLQRRKSWALTGTPLENSITDILAIYQFAMSGLLNAGMDRKSMLNRMAPFYLRRRKADVQPELPPIIEQEVPLEMTGMQKLTYERQWQGRMTNFIGGIAVSTVHLFALITRLKQLCNYEPISGESVKLEALQSICHDMGDSDRLIVFSQYVKTLSWVAGHLLSDMTLDIYHGGLNEADRDSMLLRFRTGPAPRVLLLSLRAAGVGLNIPEATDVVMFDRWWNPAVEAQAVNRAHRFGRTAPLHVFRFVVANSIEERILEILKKKGELFDQYVEKASIATVTPFTRRELLNILCIEQHG